MKTPAISNTKIFLFWAPLLFLWLVLAFEFPLLTMIITHLPNKEINLAAFGVTYSIFLLAESPLLMFNMVAIKLIKNKESYQKIRNFFSYVVSFLLLFILLLVFTPLFQYLFISQLSFASSIIVLSQLALIILIPAFISVGYRAFYQGILISTNKQHLMFYAIVIRIIVSIVTALILAKWTSLNSVYIAVIGYSTGVFIEALLTRVFSRISIADIFSRQIEYYLSYSKIYQFYYPLIITTIASIITTPIITIFLNFSFHSTLSLAVFPVINALIMLFKSSAMSLQNVLIYFLNLSEEFAQNLKNFLLIVAALMLTILVGIIYTPLLTIYLTKINALQTDLAQAAVLPLKILLIYPILTLLVIWQRSLLIHQFKTHTLNWSVFAELFGLVFSLIVLWNFDPAYGLINASIALVFGRICSNLFLYLALKNGSATQGVKID